MAKRNILYELKYQLRHGTIATQFSWQHDPEVINWCRRNSNLWRSVLKELPNGAIKAKRTQRKNSNKNSRLQGGNKLQRPAIKRATV